MIDPRGLHDPSQPSDDAPGYAPRGDFLMGLAEEAIKETRRRKVEKEIAVLALALKDYKDKISSRRYEQLMNRLAELKSQLNSNP
ncbi:hypothetical protein [Synechococcus sp. MU1650]|uniref:hypothetical protein n=1 Tax=Synechococcus sp. MU1650 TaxID=2508352 RepID=UPI001CF91E00|nr:hypothetical protein [Synechococcus sp. MU1650]MCB4378219.1 hypothetical protein [Synechococcus sp. MU1650]